MPLVTYRGAAIRSNFMQQACGRLKKGISSAPVSFAIETQLGPCHHCDGEL